ncbi:MAG: thioredoxin domain-containing protein [Alphaproteobacteria bacterium]|nr:thioredoxin domain-containing protein [Alphaproteobacteria bacterium]
MRKAAFLLTIAFFALSPALARATVTPALAAAAAGPVAPPPPPISSFSPAQRAEIEGIIKHYLTVSNPEVIAEGLQNLQQHSQEAETAKTKDAIAKAKDRLYNDPSSPVGGNPKGNVTVVEFFDYQCPYCKASHEAVDELLKKDKNVRYIYKEFPILGVSSMFASEAALASVKQHKYIEFHNALMKARFSHSANPPADKAEVFKAAKEAGLNIAKLKKDMKSKEVSDIIDADIKLGQDIGVRGTPMFIIGDNIYPGAMQYDQLSQAVAEAREAGKKK